MHAVRQPDDPRNNPTHPAWYGPPPIPHNPAIHRFLWLRSLPEADRQRLLADAETAAADAETARLAAAAKEEKARIKREAAEEKARPSREAAEKKRRDEEAAKAKAEATIYKERWL